MKLSRFQITVPPGVLVVTLNGKAISDVSLHARSLKHLPGPTGAAQKRVATELTCYFSDPRTPLKWPLQIDGSDYQLRIWRALCKIPVGRVKTYGQLAQEVGGSPRSVGNACRQNPIPIYIPCHRVVASQGIGGFAGQTRGQRITLKRWLLEHEGVAGFA